MEPALSVVVGMVSSGDTDNGIQDPPVKDSHQEIQDLCLDRSRANIKAQGIVQTRMHDKPVYVYSIHK